MLHQKYSVIRIFFTISDMSDQNSLFQRDIFLSKIP